jgi:hypothetical protein
VVTTLGIVTMFRDEASYLVEWVRYHLLAGVSRFWLYDHLSTDDWRAALEPYIASGSVTVISWPYPHEIGDLRARRRTQVAACKDGLRRAIGEVAWVAAIDVDEFLLPTCWPTVPECLEACFSDASAVYVNWRMFGTNEVVVLPGDPLLGRLTACSTPGHPENWTGKSLTRPDRVRVDDVWSIHHFPIRRGDRYTDGVGHEIFLDERDDLRDLNGYADGYIRINHYNLRDEHFYQTRRLREAKGGVLNKSVARLVEHYASFGMMQDRSILDFLERHHRLSYDEIWRRSAETTLPGPSLASHLGSAHACMMDAAPSVAVASHVTPSISIVFVAGRREPRLDWLLDGIDKQAIDGDAIEIVVVDLYGRSAAELGCREVSGVSHVMITEPMPTLWQGSHRIFSDNWWAASSARNTGIVLCQGDYVAFLDDCQHLGPRWLETVRTGARARDSVLAGTYDIHDDPNDLGVIVDHRRSLAARGKIDCGGGWLYGGSFALPLEWLLEVNGFEDGTNGLAGEDCILGLMLANLGRRVDFVPLMSSWKERPVGSGHGLLVCDKGVHPDDKHRAALDRFGKRTRTEFTPDLRQLRYAIASGGDFPAVDRDAEVFDWYDDRPLREMAADGVPYRTGGVVRRRS